MSMAVDSDIPVDKVPPSVQLTFFCRQRLHGRSVGLHFTLRLRQESHAPSRT